MSRTAVAAPILAACAAIGCVHAPPAGPSGPAAAVDVRELREAVAPCPVPLTDAALDDLRTYEVCRLPVSVVRLVRNDEADDELELPDLASLRRHAGKVPRATFEAQLHRFADPRAVLQGHVLLDRERDVLWPDPVLAPDVAIPFAPPGPDGLGACADAHGCAGRLVAPPEADRPWRPERRAALRAMATAARPLAGLRVGVDPGHSGGPFGRFESRQVTFVDASGRAVALQEGDLTLRTALELRDKLVAMGATVALTRDAPGLVHDIPLHALRPAAERLLRHVALEPALERAVQELAPADRLRLRSSLAVHAVRRSSRFESLRARARLLSRAEPDVTLSIHYNAAPPGGRKGGQELVAMIRGFPDEARLYNPYHRWRALEGAFAIADFDASAHLAAACVQAMSDRLRVPTARSGRYADHLPIRDAGGEPTGVDAWDGVVLRYLDGVAVLTEGPDVDDPDEVPRLAAALAAPPGTPGTPTERYADALAACVREFAGRWLGSDRDPFSGDPIRGGSR